MLWWPMQFDAPAPAAFLDRDGTLIVERNYLADPDGVEFVEGAFEALALLRDAGYKLVIVTNQSGIGRGLYSLEDYRAVEARVESELAARGIQLDGVYFCPHDPDASDPCDCRKPGPGMYRDAQRNLNVDLAASVYVGDRLKDVEPARLFGGRAFLVQTGYGADHASLATSDVIVTENLLAAAHRIVGKSRTTP